MMVRVQRCLRTYQFVFTKCVAASVSTCTSLTFTSVAETEIQKKENLGDDHR